MAIEIITKEDLNEFVEDTDQANYQLNLIKSKIMENKVQ